jgi:arylsulfatase A-like enzyme/thioredoxin-like negative regulator of GroEL
LISKKGDGGMTGKKKVLSWLLGLSALFVVGVLFVSKTDETEPMGLAHPHVIIITLDTTRADRLGCYGYQKAITPNLDELCREGVRFEQCIAPAVFTLPAHASIFTGMYPAHHAVRINGSAALSSRAVTLAEYLRDAGYLGAAFISSFVLDGRWGLKQGFDFYDDKIVMENKRQFDIGKVQRPADRVVDSAISWLNGRTDVKPLFMWLHFYDPHTPYDPPQEFRRAHPETVQGLYDGEISFMDHQIGRFIDDLKKRGMYDNCTVVALGDHGESLGDHGELTHGFFAYQSTIHVPMIMKFPQGQFAGMSISSPVSAVDLTPTILSLLGLKEKEALNGHSLLPLLNQSGKRRGIVLAESLAPFLLYGWAPIYAAIDGSSKLIDTPESEFFDLQEDPFEKNNLYGRKPVQGGLLRKKLKTYLSSVEKKQISTDSANLDQETLNKLASLGYATLSGKPVKEIENGVKREDPKKKFTVYQRIELAAAFLTEEKYEEAVKILTDLVSSEPEIPQVRLLLASTHLSQKDEGAAKKQLDWILKKNPDHVQALIAMANILKLEKKFEEMVSLCQKAILLDENNTQAFALIGDMHMSQNDFPKALPYLERALEIQPKLNQNRINLAACLIGLDRLDEAEALLLQVADEDADFAALHYHIGLIHHKKKSYPLAKKHYHRELSEHPNYIPARFNLGDIYYQEKSYREYIKEMEAIISIEPEMAKGYLFLARGLLTGDSAGYRRGLGLVKQGLGYAREKKLKILGYYLLADFYSRLNEQDRTQLMLKKAKDLGNREKQ